MRKFISVSLAMLASIILILVLVFTSIGLVINDETFINNEFTKLAISQKMAISNVDLVRSMTRLVDYMEGDADDINVEVTIDGQTKQMFDYPQEAEHMADVRQIYMTIAGYRDIGVLVMLILFLFAAVFHFRMAPQYLSQGYLSGAFVMLLLFGFLGTWAALDFSNFWTFFHQTLFWNDLWLFDGTQSRMINMLPEDVFSDIISRVALYAGSVIAVLIALSTTALVVSSAGYKRRRAITLARKKAQEEAANLRKKSRAEAKAAAEKEKRLAQKRARITAIKAQKHAAAEAAAKEAERERRLMAKREQKRTAEEARAVSAVEREAAQPALEREAKPRREEPQRPASPARPAPAAAKKPAKKTGNVHDETGFFDDED
jgi:integral membrane protein (TIGR01906 family)